MRPSYRPVVTCTTFNCYEEEHVFLPIITIIIISCLYSGATMSAGLTSSVTDATQTATGRNQDIETDMAHTNAIHNCLVIRSYQTVMNIHSIQAFGGTLENCSTLQGRFISLEREKNARLKIQLAIKPEFGRVKNWPYNYNSVTYMSSSQENEEEMISILHCKSHPPSNERCATYSSFLLPMHY